VDILVPLIQGTSSKLKEYFGGEQEVNNSRGKKLLTSSPFVWIIAIKLIYLCKLVKEEQGWSSFFSLQRETKQQIEIEIDTEETELEARNEIQQGRNKTKTDNKPSSYWQQERRRKSTKTHQQ